MVLLKRRTMIDHNMKPFNIQELLSTAKQRTGLSDFGAPDFVEGMDMFFASLNEQGVISDDRWQHAHDRFIRLLVNRLYFAKDLAEHPEILDENVDAPLVMESLPRTGSTKLHRLLGASNALNAVRMWQAHNFARIPGEADGGQARRIAECRAYEQWMYQTSPEIITGHPMFTDEPEEDNPVGEFTFRHTYIGGVFNVPRYSQWLAAADMKPTYDYFLQQIKYLQWQLQPKTAKPWLLKMPNHMGNEANLTRVFKKPRFVITHRDPVKCVTSIAIPVKTMRKLYSDEDTPSLLGAALIQLFSKMALDHLEWRKKNPDIPVLDIPYKEVNADGLGVARKVFDFLGLPLDDDAMQRMRAWDENNRRDKHPKNTYSAEEIGTTDDAIREAFEPYTERYSRYF